MSKPHGPVVYSVEDDNADNGTGLVFHGSLKEACDHARAVSSKPAEWDLMNPVIQWNKECRVHRIVLVKPTKKGCLCMLNSLWYAHDSKTIAVFRNGKRLKKINDVLRR